MRDSKYNVKCQVYIQTTYNSTKYERMKHSVQKAEMSDWVKKIN